LDLYKRLKGEKPKDAKKIDGNNVELTLRDGNKVVVNNNVFHLHNDPVIVKGLSDSRLHYVERKSTASSSNMRLLNKSSSKNPRRSTLKPRASNLKLKTKRKDSKRLS